MAPWGDSKLFFCILFIIGFSTVTVAQVIRDCCLSVTNKQIDKRFVVDYSEQARGCSVHATVLVTRLGKKLCAPPKQQQWVQNVIKHVDHLKQRCKKENYKGNRCFGVKPE
ncbi:eotaxin-like [Girardinichthys multiradiatus]|uniref:eotaxin-like n=1 Tax=Girardinichthys multiradiatus TaxID=208333 RepID=UPI001FABFAC7|nr:eotaxin-like [Girardinichthys multiradiatus]